MSGKKKRAREELALFALLKKSLAEDEICEVLTGALLSLDTVGFERLYSRLDEDGGETIHRVMGSCGTEALKPESVTSQAKIRQE